MALLIVWHRLPIKLRKSRVETFKGATGVSAIVDESMWCDDPSIVDDEV